MKSPRSGRQAQRHAEEALAEALPQKATVPLASQEIQTPDNLFFNPFQSSICDPNVLVAIFTVASVDMRWKGACAFGVFGSALFASCYTPAFQVSW